MGRSLGLTLGILGLGGCVATPSTSPHRSAGGAEVETSPSTPPDTAGATSRGCTDIEPLRSVVCIETTAPLSFYGPAGGTGSITQYWNAFRGTGTVSEVGGALAPIEGSEPMLYFDACDAAHVQTVRLEDAEGAMWTFGWDAPWTSADATTIAPGDELDFAVELVWGWTSGESFVLSDATGPRVWFGMAETLDLTPWGLSVVVNRADYCLFDDPSWGGDSRHFLTTVSWPGGDAGLRSGQSTPVALAGRDLEVTVPYAFEYEDCMDGCSGSYWTGWETE